MRVFPNCLLISFTDDPTDANIVIESLKHSKAMRTNEHQLIRRLPDGMNDLYKQKMQRLEEDDREMLLTALRWLMCSEGKVETALVADDIEHCYEDLGYDQDDLEYKENEEADSSLVAFGVSAGMGFQDKNIDNEERESIRRLKAVGRDFLKFSSDIVEVQHQSVRDFINSVEGSLLRDSRICPECVKRMNQDSIYQAAPKHGHLMMVESIFQKLMSPSFQEKFIIKGFGKINKDKADAALVTLQSLVQLSGLSLKHQSNDGSVTTQSRPGVIMEYNTARDTVSFGMEKTDSTIELEAQSISPTPDLPNTDDDEEVPPRYELAQWPRHLRAAEAAWPAAERDAVLQERWGTLYDTIEAFLSPESTVFKAWSKQLKLWQEKPWDPLHVVAHFGILEIMQRRIQYGTNVNLSDEDGRTPLHLACSEDRGNVGVELLIQHDADLNSLTKRKQTPLFLLTESSGSPKLFQYLLDHGAKPEIPDEDGWTCLHRAAGNRNRELCRILLGCSTVDVNAQDRDGDTPLHWMFQFPNALPDLVQLFLDRGVKVNEQNNNREAPLYLACTVGNVPATRLLLDYHADIDQVNDFGRTALHAAVQAENLELVKLLVERGIDVYRKDRNGRDSFMHAAAQLGGDILGFFLGSLKPQESLNQALMSRDVYGDTPLHHSVETGNSKSVDMLLKAGNAVAMCSQHNDIGWTPLTKAAHDGYLNIVELCLANGADVLSWDRKINRPLTEALKSWKKSYNSRKGDFAQICQILASVFSNDAQKADILDLAIETGVIELTETLACSVNTVDVHGWTPTMLAKQCKQYEIVKSLSHYDRGSTIRGLEAMGDVAVMRPPSRWSTFAKHLQPILSEDGLEVACLNGKILTLFNYLASIDSSRFHGFNLPNHCTNGSSSCCGTRRVLLRD